MPLSYWSDFFHGLESYNHLVQHKKQHNWKVLLDRFCPVLCLIGQISTTDLKFGTTLYKCNANGHFLPYTPSLSQTVRKSSRTVLFFFFFGVIFFLNQFLSFKSFGALFLRSFLVIVHAVKI